MSTSQDFEARRRERLQRQRKQRERMRIIKIILSAALFILVIVIIISAISKCSSKNESQGTPIDNSTVTENPTESEIPVTPQSAVTGIPEPDPEDNDLLTVVKNSGQKGHVYLTFDNGPDETITPQILDILRRYNIKATFFMVGKEIEKNPGLCTRVMQEGHLAAVRSYTNVYETVYSNEATFMDEVNKTYELITRCSPDGTEPFKLFRFPGGSSYTSTAKFMKKLAENGFYYCDWNCSTGDDTTGVAKTAENLLYYFNQNKPQLNNLVILMHDSADKQYTVDMLESLITQLIDEGWVFSRLDEIDFSNAPEDNTTDAPADETPEPDSGNNIISTTVAPSSSAGTSSTTGNTSSGTASGTGTGSSSGSSSSSGTSSSGTTSTGSSRNTTTSGSASSGAASGGSSASSSGGSSTAAGSSASSASSDSGNSNIIESE